MKIKIHSAIGSRLSVRTLAGTYHGILTGHVMSIEMAPYYDYRDSAYNEFFNRMRAVTDNMRYGSTRGSSFGEPPPPMPTLFQREVPVSLLLDTGHGVESISYEHIVSWRLDENDETPA